MSLITKTKTGSDQYMFLLNELGTNVGSFISTKVVRDQIRSSYYNLKSYPYMEKLWFLTYLEKRQLVLIRLLERLLYSILKEKEFYKFDPIEMNKLDTTLMKNRTIRTLEVNGFHLKSPNYRKQLLLRLTLKYRGKISENKYYTIGSKLNIPMYTLNKDFLYENFNYIQNNKNINKKFGIDLLIKPIKYIGTEFKQFKQSFKYLMVSKDDTKMVQEFKEYINENITPYKIQTTTVHLLNILRELGLLIK